MDGSTTAETKPRRRLARSEHGTGHTSGNAHVAADLVKFATPNGLKRNRREVEELLVYVMKNGWRGVAKSGESQAIKFDTHDSYLEKIFEEASKRAFVTLSSAKVINLVNEIRFHRSQAK